MTPFFVSQTRAGKKPDWGVLLSLVLTRMAWAGTSMSPPSQTVILHPAPAPPLRIDFNYNFQNALPPFPREPALPGKEIARRIIPTVPPTPFLRNITDNELYLNTDHAPDFVNGKLATYRSFYNGHAIFTNLAATSFRDGLEIPYTLDLFTYERFCSGWLEVRSGWAGQFAVAGQTWRLTVVDNLNGQIGRDDTLHFQRLPPTKTGRGIAITPVPQALFLDGHAFSRSVQSSSTLDQFRMVVVLASAISLPSLVFFTFILLALRSPLYRDRFAHAFGVTSLAPEPIVKAESLPDRHQSTDKMPTATRF